MVVTISLALLFGAITGALVWAKRVSIAAAAVIWLSGFTMAGTGAGGPINHFIATTLAHLAH